MLHNIYIYDFIYIYVSFTASTCQHMNRSVMIRIAGLHPRRNGVLNPRLFKPVYLTRCRKTMAHEKVSWKGGEA